MRVPLDVQSGGCAGSNTTQITMSGNSKSNYTLTKRSTNGNGRGKKKNGGKARGPIKGFPGITQSVALSVNNAFGDTAKPQTVIQGLDAFDSSHVPLPRAVGDYTVVRTTEVFSSKSEFNLLGPVKLGNHPGSRSSDAWSNICCLRSNPTITNGAYSINTTSGTYPVTFSSMGAGTSWQDARLTPAAFTVKVMNPEALQTTSGMVYIGRARQMLNPGGSTRTWDELANELISYSSPELCAAGRLALRGVKVDAVPYDMNSLADFRPLDQFTNTPFTWTNDEAMFDGFAPIFVYNPNNVELPLMMCCEWRVRFDPSNPAYATHTYHRPSTPGYWDRVQRIGSALGNGVMDLAEKSAPQFLMNVAQQAVKRQLMLT